MKDDKQKDLQTKQDAFDAAKAKAINALANPRKIYIVRGHHFSSRDRGFLMFHMRRAHTIMFMAVVKRRMH